MNLTVPNESSWLLFENFLANFLDKPPSLSIMPESTFSDLAPLDSGGGFMSVLDLCDREIAAVPMEATVADAIHKMLDFHVGAVAVVDSEYRVAGIFTERDVLRKMSLTRLDPQTTSIRDLMTTPVEMATRETGPGEALSIMLERHFRHLPVADDNGKLLGILSIRNLLEWRVDELSRELDSLEQYVSNDGPGG